MLGLRREKPPSNVRADSFTHSFAHSLVRWIYFLNCPISSFSSFTYSYPRQFTHSSIPAVTCSLIHLLLSFRSRNNFDSLTYPLLRCPIHTSTPLCTYTPLHSLIDTFHSLTHSFSRPLTLTPHVPFTFTRSLSRPPTHSLTNSQGLHTSLSFIACELSPSSLCCKSC